VRNSLFKQWVGGANSVWVNKALPLLASDLSVVGDLILIMEKSVVFSAPCLKPLILAHFGASKK
jgi:hypothetical protein